MNTTGGAAGVFRVGITPDFYTEARGRFEAAVESSFGGVGGLEWGPMPPQPGKLATPDALDQFDAIFSLGLKITRKSLAGVRRLALVGRWGVGYDMIDVAALTDADVALAITPGAVRRPVAEAIFTFIFALSTNLLEQDRTVRAGRWRGDLPRLGRNIAGRTLGSIGCGNIAREMFRMARSLGFARLIAHDPYVDSCTVAELGVELASLEQVLRESDFVTINTLLNDATRRLIGEAELRQMKPTAYLINTARGPIVQETALVRALRERWIAGAGLDVFEREPLPADSPLRALDNVILTPHGLAWTEEIVRDNGLEACSNILAVSRGEVPASVVNREVIERPGFQKKLERYRRSA
ncbi:MAG TPA: NAD(P)-dependent oxidoreductase [Bryobacteraceae bacterium]|nr:NAD(P)-dependent oxidoreductase [Bryobacteraceae bacterium]